MFVHENTCVCLDPRSLTAPTLLCPVTSLSMTFPCALPGLLHSTVMMRESNEPPHRCREMMLGCLRSAQALGTKEFSLAQG